MSATLEEISELIKKVTKDKNAVITEASTAKDVRNWDSLTHVFIIVEIEKKYKIKFKASEAQKAKNVGELIQLVNTKLQ